MNTYYYEIEARQRTQTLLNESSNARLLHNNPLQKLSFETLRAGWNTLFRAVLQLSLADSQFIKTSKLVKVVAHQK